MIKAFSQLNRVPSVRYAVFLLLLADCGGDLAQFGTGACASGSANCQEGGNGTLRSHLFKDVTLFC